MGVTESEYIRKMLDQEFDVRTRREKLRTRQEKLKALAGSVTLKGKLDGWAKDIYKNNWRW